MTATVGEGQKLWTTLLLGLADIVLAANIWGHARDQQQAAQARADSKAVRKQVRAGGSAHWAAHTVCASAGGCTGRVALGGGRGGASR